MVCRRCRLLGRTSARLVRLQNVVFPAPETMSGRIILLTGANGGLGQAIARSFLQSGTDDFVWLGIHKATEQASLLAKEFSGRCDLLPLDVTRVDSWEGAVKSILQQHQRIDVLVNNAGRHRDGLLATLPEEAWSSVLATNLDSVFHGCRAVLPAMISQKFGRIINIASLSALLAPAGQANYAAAKPGAVALTQALGKEVARIGITVNAVCSGCIETEALKAMNDDARKAGESRGRRRRFF